MAQRPRGAARCALLLAGCWLATACVDNPVWLPDLDPAFHRCQVEPVFDHSCATLACHGDGRRPFHVFTRNRLRLAGDATDLNQPLTEAEIAANFDNARGFLADRPQDSWLLKKPLEQSAGGYFHLGKHQFAGPDVWASTDDAEYQVVLQWLRGATDDPTCVAKGTL